jgi:hypothetical protein
MVAEAEGEGHEAAGGAAPEEGEVDARPAAVGAPPRLDPDVLGRTLAFLPMADLAAAAQVRRWAA